MEISSTELNLDEIHSDVVLCSKTRDELYNETVLTYFKGPYLHGRVSVHPTIRQSFSRSTRRSVGRLLMSSRVNADLDVRPLLLLLTRRRRTFISNSNLVISVLHVSTLKHHAMLAVAWHWACRCNIDRK
jgi:hypothetical protein